MHLSVNIEFKLIEVDSYRCDQLAVYERKGCTTVSEKCRFKIGVLNLKFKMVYFNIYVELEQI